MLVRSAFSANIKERRDCSTALFDEEGRMITQAEHIPVHLGAMPEAVAAVQILVRPLAFLSNAFVATATMPGWLGVIAEWNPLSATVSATRELFGNPGWGGDSWFAQHAPLTWILEQ